MDAKVIRSGINSAIIFLLVGTALGSFGGWSALVELSSNFFGVLIIAGVLSTLLGYIYSYWFDDFLPGTTLMKGVLFGTLVWISFLIVGGVTEFFKEAVYAGNNGQYVFLSLVSHVVWGGSLSLFANSKS
jgi:hypothetical protein